MTKREFSVFLEDDGQKQVSQPELSSENKEVFHGWKESRRVFWAEEE